MDQALLFDSPHQLCDFVRLHAQVSKPIGAYQLCRISGLGGQPQIVLLNLSIRKNRKVSPAKRVKVKLDQHKIVVDGEQHKVLQSCLANTLIECVQLQPSQSEHHKESVFFWVSNPAHVAEIFLQSVHLHNDRIQYASVSKSNKAATLIRIDRPSYFLIQKCLEEYSDDVSIYYQDTADIFIRWGWQHPLTDWWPQIDCQPENLAFIDPKNQITIVEPILWQDAYDLTNLSLDFHYERLVTKASEAPPKFEVKLRLTPKATNLPEPELWILDQAGLLQLEQNLQLSDQETLHNWQVAAQRIENKQEDYIIIREILLNTSNRSHHEYSGTAFSRYKGINNLMLPIDYELLPPLRRDAYRQLFELKPGYVTLLFPKPEELNTSFDIITIDEKHFEPITSYIDYLIDQNSEKLKNLLASTAFDFKHYLKAPTNPNIAAGSKPSISPSLSNLPLQNATLVNQKQNKPTENQAQLGPESTAPENQLQRQEIDLERDLIQSSSTTASWINLLVCKSKLDKPSEALIAAIEALWLAKGSPQEDDLINTTQQLCQQILEVPANSITSEDQEWLRRAAVFATILNSPKPTETDQWISDTTAFLREHELGLRSKERWLAWSRVLMLNQDERKESQLREEIRNRITEKGLGIEETPIFIRNRIFTDRKIDREDSENHAAWEAASESLEVINSIISEFRSERLNYVSTAIMARAYSKLGDVNNVQSLLQNEPVADDCTQAWVTLFEIEALTEFDETRSKAKLDSLSQLLDQAGEDTKNAVNQMQQTYTDSSESDNLAAFLALKNHERTYPRGPHSQAGVLLDLNTKLQEQIELGNESTSVNLMHNLMTLQDKTLYNDYIKLPQVVETIIEGIDKFKWGSQGGALGNQFERFSNQVYRHVDHPNNHFYGSILHSNLALGLLTTDRIEEAEKQLKHAEKLVFDSSLTDLDFIDAAAALVKTIEQLPLPLRKERLLNLIQQVAIRFDTETPNPYLLNERLFEIVARLVDQIAEAAVSQDRLSLKQFRSYQLQDEFIILKRIQSESFINN